MRKNKVFHEKSMSEYVMPVPGAQPAPIATDPLGSYTGIPADIFEKPVQDADDL